MTEILYKLFLKNKDRDTEEGRNAYGSFAGIVGICCNGTLCMLKIAIGLFTGSISIIADGVNNLSDAASSVITLIGFKISSKPADKEHPFGHARSEYLAALVVAIMILLIGVELLKSSYQKLFTPAPIELNFVAIGILLFSVALKWWMMVFNTNTGKLISSPVLVATAQDSKNDVVTTISVIIAIILSNIIQFQLDGIAGMMVSAFIIFSGIKLLLETVSPLLGEAPDGELVQEIKNLVLSGEGVLGIHDLIIHDYGPARRFGSVHIEMSSKEDVLKSHDTIDNLERECKEKLNVVLVIHYDPIENDCDEVNEYKKTVADKLLDIDSRLSLHDFRMVKGPDHTNLIFDVESPFGVDINEQEIKSKLEEYLQKDGKKVFCVVTVDKV